MKISIVAAPILALAITVLPSPVLAETPYTWSFSCSTNGLVVSTGGSYAWLQDGVAIANQTFTLSCLNGSFAGTGNVPSNANGISASVWASVGGCIKNFCGTCYSKSDSSGVTKSLSSSQSVSISLHASVNEQQCGSASASFKLRS